MRCSGRLDRGRGNLLGAQLHLFAECTSARFSSRTVVPFVPFVLFAVRSGLVRIFWTGLFSSQSMSLFLLLLTPFAVRRRWRWFHQWPIINAPQTKSGPRYKRGVVTHIPLNQGINSWRWVPSTKLSVRRPSIRKHRRLG